MKNYRGLEYPWVKVFLGAMFTYQLCYWGWEKMRIDEITAEKNGKCRQSCHSNADIMLISIYSGYQRARAGTRRLYTTKVPSMKPQAISSYD